MTVLTFLQQPGPEKVRAEMPSRGPSPVRTAANRPFTSSVRPWEFGFGIVLTGQGLVPCNPVRKEASITDCTDPKPGNPPFHPCRKDGPSSRSVLFRCFPEITSHGQSSFATGPLKRLQHCRPPMEHPSNWPPFDPRSTVERRHADQATTQKLQRRTPAGSAGSAETPQRTPT